MVNQPGTKHHGTMEKLKQCFPRSEAHRRVLATTEQPRRRCCRPRGRRARTASSRRIQATKVGWLGAQGIGEAGIGFAEMATALGRRRELDGAAVVVTGKTEEEEKRRRRCLGSYNATQKLTEATTEPFPCQRDAKDGHDAPGMPKKVDGGHCSQ